jgi:hypothetical protein
MKTCACIINFEDPWYAYKSGEAGGQHMVSNRLLALLGRFRSLDLFGTAELKYDSKYKHKCSHYSIN